MRSTNSAFSVKIRMADQVCRLHISHHSQTTPSPFRSYIQREAGCPLGTGTIP